MLVFLSMLQWKDQSPKVSVVEWESGFFQNNITCVTFYVNYGGFFVYILYVF